MRYNNYSKIHGRASIVPMGKSSWLLMAGKKNPEPSETNSKSVDQAPTNGSINPAPRRETSEQIGADLPDSTKDFSKTKERLKKINESLIETNEELKRVWAQRLRDSEDAIEKNKEKVVEDIFKTEEQLAKTSAKVERKQQEASESLKGKVGVNSTSFAAGRSLVGPIPNKESIVITVSVLGLIFFVLIKRLLSGK